jgi:hypothetical protein
MKEFNTIISLIDRANNEIKRHKKIKKEHPAWYSGHKNKAQRALLTARELLLEESKRLDLGGEEE